LVGGILTILRALGVLPTNIFTAYGMQLGSAVEMLMLAFALADRFNAMRREKELAQSEALQAHRDALQAQSKRLEAEQQLVETLRSSEKLLERRVSERTTELSESLNQLKQTQAELVQADKLASLGALVAGVAHELNTPIGNALTSASALEGSATEMRDAMARGELRKSSLTYFVDSAVPMAELIVRSCQRAASLINSFKQVAVDQTSEHRREFDLRSMVEDNIASLRPSFGKAPWVIEIDIRAQIICDSYPGPLGQVISNLVQNAVVHAFEGRSHGRLDISSSEQGDMVEITIADDGKGMDKAVAEHIFEPFYTTRLGQGGSGLGLSISMNIVTGVLGGTLVVRSQPGHGSRFIVKIPLIAPHQARSSSR